MSSQRRTTIPLLVRFRLPFFFKLLRGCHPQLLLIVIIVSGVMSGIFTAAESAAVAVAYTLFLSVVVYHGIKIKDLPRIPLDASGTAFVIMF